MKNWYNNIRKTEKFKQLSFEKNQIDENARVVELLSDTKKQLMALQQEQGQPKRETQSKNTGTTDRRGSGLKLVDVRRLDNTLGRLVVAVEEKEEEANT